ncbi:MAG: flagellar hook-length control protein FliK [Phycisphaerae bacterium]
MISSMEAAATANPLHSATRTSTGNPAQQIAQFLNGGRIGEAESARALTSSSGGSEQTGLPGKQGTGRAGGGETSDPSATGRRLGQRPGDVEAARRTPFDDLIRSIRLRSNGRITSARMQLHPPELGRMQVELRVTDRRIELDIRTETASARDLVADRGERLVAALHQHGIEVDRFDVTADAEGSGRDALQENQDGHVSTGQGGSDMAEPDQVPLSGTGEPDDFDAEITSTVVAEQRLDVRV